MKKSNVFLVSLGILAITAVTFISVIMANKESRDYTFDVDGSGVVYAKADIANISVGLQTETMKTAAEATNESVEKMNNIVASIKDLGIEDKDIKTSNYSLSPVYNWTDNKGRELDGYQVYQSLDIKVRNLEIIGDIISETTKQGANQIGSINFTIDDEYELKNQARELAIAKAKEKAELIASQTGMKLGEIKNLYESSYIPNYSNYSNAKMEMSMDDGFALSSPSIETGQNEIRVEVTISYEVK